MQLFYVEFLLRPLHNKKTRLRRCVFCSSAISISDEPSARNCCREKPAIRSQRVRDSLAEADFVFANLESVISDQHGETQSKKSNIVFCAPPVAGAVLRDAHISIVVDGEQSCVRLRHERHCRDGALFERSRRSFYRNDRPTARRVFRPLLSRSMEFESVLWHIRNLSIFAAHGRVIFRSTTAFARGKKSIL